MKTTPPEVDDLGPVEPFGTTLEQVHALNPNVEWITGSLVGQTGVSRAQAHAWIGDLSARVEVVLDRRRDLTDEQRAALDILAADAVAHGAASYASAAAHPEQVGKAELAYHQVLWRRHESILELATTQLETWLPGGGVGAGRAAASFPPAAVPDGIRF